METNEGTMDPGLSDKIKDTVLTTAPPKVDLAKRFIAALVDAVLASVVSTIPVIGSIAGTAYILARDGLDVEFMQGRSIGKKLMKLQPVRLDGEPMDLATSVRRNWVFAIGALAGFVAWVPFFGALAVIVLGLLGFLAGVYEIYLVATDPEGRRYGDRFAGTKVIEVDE